jgi:hypothetical protein
MAGLKGHFFLRRFVRDLAPGTAAWGDMKLNWFGILVEQISYGQQGGIGMSILSIRPPHQLQGMA